jgi:peptidoglycan hydrolase CwlO-like protein
MDWTTILVAVIGSGVLSTILGAIINKRERDSKNDGIDISNLQALVQTLAGRVDAVEKKADEDREKAHGYITELREEIIALRNQVNTLERVTTQAYRCKYPDNIQDCPVVKAYEAKCCDACIQAEED